MKKRELFIEIFGGIVFIITTVVSIPLFIIILEWLGG